MRPPTVGGDGGALLGGGLLGGRGGSPQAAVAAHSILWGGRGAGRVQEGVGEELWEGDALHGVAPQQLHMHEAVLGVHKGGEGV